MNLKVFKRRVIITGLMMTFIACFFVYRFVNLHFSEKIRIPVREDSEIRRGHIKDRHGYIFAISIERFSLFANPEEIENPEEVAKVLAPIINLRKDFILKRIKRKKRFVWLKRKIEDDAAERIRRLEIKGLHFKKEFWRAYPHINLASNIIGFVDVDNNGLEGIEYRYDNILSGREKGSIVSNKKDFINGSNISLSIDRFIQYISENEIENGVKEFNALRGVLVVLEIETGRVLAMAKFPNFNPNYYYRYSDEVRGNFGIVNAFEPGSTMKVFALASILEYFPKATNMKYKCRGSIDIGDVTIRCGKIHGMMNLDDIIKHSCNSGIIHFMKQVSKNDYYNILRRFGFGEKTGIEFPGESKGLLRPVSAWSGLSKYSISIGQEISVTSLQLAAAFGAVGNGGIYLLPTLIESIESADGTTTQSFFPRSKGRIIHKDIAKRMLRTMRGVVTGGTGKGAYLEYYNAVGKTGTAQKSMRRGGYYPDRFIASFIGLAPYEKPDVCILAVLDEPKGILSGGEAAAPIFARVARRVLTYRGIKTKRIVAEDPYRKKSKTGKFDGVTMPDFRGLRMSESIKLILKMQKRHSFQYSFIGSGKVYKQHPLPRTKLSGQKIALYLIER